MFVLEKKLFGTWKSAKKVIACDRKQELREIIQAEPSLVKNTRVATITKNGRTAVTYNVAGFARLIA